MLESECMTPQPGTEHIATTMLDTTMIQLFDGIMIVICLKVKHLLLW